MDQQYLDAYHGIRQKADVFDPASSEKGQALFAFYSANLVNYLPFIPYQEHLTLFRETLISQKMSFLDQTYFGGEAPFRIQGWDTQWVKQVRSRPGIICTMHAGSYRLINYLLVRDQIPYALLISGKVREDQEALFQQLYHLQHQENETKLVLVDAEKPTAPITLMRLLRRGINLLVYMDGDSGVHLSGKDKLWQIPFLGQHIHVRKGVAYLAQKLDVPIYPVFNFREPDASIRFFCGQPILPGQIDKEHFGLFTALAIYDQFASLLMHYPAQWENWLYIHKNLDIRKRIPREETVILSKESLVPDRFGIFSKNGHYFLLDKRQYRIFPLPDDKFHHPIKQ